VLELQINTTLLEVEAKKRRTTSQQLYDLEVTKRIAPPSPAEIKKFIEDNRDEFEGVEAEAANQKVSVILHGERETKLSDQLVTRLRATTPVVLPVDINTPNLSPATVIATVGGRPIQVGLLNERLKPIIYNMRLSAYEIEKKAADRIVDDSLLLAEASKRNVAPEEIIRGEISDKLHGPTEAEVAKFYSDNKTRISGDLTRPDPGMPANLDDAAKDEHP